MDWASCRSNQLTDWESKFLTEASQYSYTQNYTWNNAQKFIWTNLLRSNSWKQKRHRGRPCLFNLKTNVCPSKGTGMAWYAAFRVSLYCLSRWAKCPAYNRVGLTLFLLYCPNSVENLKTRLFFDINNCQLPFTGTLHSTT